MASGWLKFLGVLALFVIGGAYFDLPVYISGLAGAFVGTLVIAHHWYQSKNRVYTRDLLFKKPFNGKLPIEIGMATVAATALKGDGTYRQKVIGESGFAENFKDLLDYAKCQDESVLELQAALVVEPANPHSHFAVAVTAGGVILGYIPQFESESLYGFLLQHRGMARANANVHFHVRQQASYVEVDLVRPFQVVPGV